MRDIDKLQTFKNTLVKHIIQRYNFSRSLS